MSAIRRGEEPAAHPDEHRRGEAGEDHQPLQGQSDVLVHVIDADQEAAVVVVDHLVAPQEEPERQGQQQHHGGAAQEARFQAAFQPEEAGIELTGFAQVREAVAQLPAARRHPVDQDADR